MVCAGGVGCAMDECWDAICIGSGLGCLAAAVELARDGRRVLILERLSNFGGAATIYRHGRLTIEASLHMTDGRSLFDAGGIYRRLGVTERLEPVRIPEFHEVRGGPLAAPVRVPSGLDAAAEALCRAFPASARPLARYFELLRGIDGTVRRLEDGTGAPTILRELLTGGLPRLLAQVPRRLGPELDRRFGDDEAVKCVLGAILGYFDDDPARLSFLLYAMNWAHYCAGGSWNLAGGSAALTRALVETVREAGGSAQRRAQVTRVLTDAAGRAAGVVWTDAAGAEHEARAPVVLAGAAPGHVAAMLPEALRAAFLARYRGRQPSISLFNVSLGLSRPAADFGVAAFSTFVQPAGLARFADMPRASAAFASPPEAAGPVPPYVLVDTERVPTRLARPGDLHGMSLTGIDRLGWWQGLDAAAEADRRRRWIDRLVADADRQFPGLAGAVEQAEIATARTMMNRLGTPAGEVYGFAPTPGRVYRQRPTGRTSVPGLFLASAYTLSGGFVGALRGGSVAGREALAQAAARKTAG